MGIVRLALRRPYTFIVFSFLILIAGIACIFTTPKDIFPNINIPVISVIWSYSGLTADEFAQRITTYSEYALSNNVNGIERLESQTIDGIGIIKLYFHPDASIQTAIAQTTASSQAILKRMPAGMLPPIIIQYYANSVPIIQMILSSPTLSEAEIYDYGIFRIRQGVSIIQGATLPTPYGGKVRQVMIDIDPVALQAKGLSARDVNDAVSNGILIYPPGDVRMGPYDYSVNMNNTPDLISAMNDLPIKKINDVIVYLRDVAHAHDGYIPQNNIVRNNGKRAVLQTFLKNGNTSTLYIVDSLWDLLPTIRAAAPEGLNIDLLFDQSIFVKAAIKSVVFEGMLAALLTGIMILIFLGSWRSTLIVLVSIPLSILSSIIILSFLGYTLNVMTLGGLALAIGILVDDATVAIENIHRNLGMGKPLRQAVLDGSYQVTIPAFVSTLAICIVFLPVTLLVGPSKFLFIPFALAVVFALATSYLLSRTLVPLLIDFLLPPEMYLYTGGQPKTALDRYHVAFEKKFEKFRDKYGELLDWSLQHRPTVLGIFAVIFLSAVIVVPFVGEDFFPLVDANQFRLHVKAASGTRIEVTEEIFGAVEDEIKKIIPPEEIDTIIDNIGLVAEPYTMSFGDSATLGPQDGEILVSLKPNHSRSTPEYVNIVRDHLKKVFPDVLFYFQPADMINQILNFGLPTPIDIRVIGYDKENNLKIAKQLVEEVFHVPGAVDVHLHQIVDAPELFVDVDRTLLANAGLSQADIANDILLTYNSSTVLTPNFWLDRKSGIPYFITVQLPKYRTNDLEGFLRTPISSPLTKEAQLLSNLATVTRRKKTAVVTHLNIQPVYDIFANVQDRDLGGVISDIDKIVAKYNKEMKPGNEIVIKGMVENMREAFFRLEIGFVFAILLVYFIMVVNFQSWLDPFVIITALPGALSGVIWMLFLTQTTFNVPSLMGLIMSVGVATANSILLITFANYQLKFGKTSSESTHTAACARLRPILMTALAMIVGMIPMALAIGEGGEQNAPLGRAVIGGLALATVTTLFFVPVVFSYLRHEPNPYLGAEPDSEPENAEIKSQ